MKRQQKKVKQQFLTFGRGRVSKICDQLKRQSKMYHFQYPKEYL